MAADTVGPATSPRTPDGAPLGPGDGVRITVHRHPDASGEFVVDENGDLILPLVDRVNVLNKPIAELKTELVERYKTFLRDPSIQVTPVYRINVLGEVRQPGLYPVDLTMTLPDVIALAGGVTPQGSLEKVTVLRSGREMDWDLADPRVRARRLDEFGFQSGDEVVVGARGRSFWESAPVIASLVSAGVVILVLATQ